MPIRTSFTAAVVFALASVVFLVVGQPVKAATVSYDSGIAMSKSIASWAALSGGSVNTNLHESFRPLSEQSPTRSTPEQEAFDAPATGRIPVVDYGHQGIAGAGLIDGPSTRSSLDVSALEHLRHDALETLPDSTEQVVVEQR